MNYVTPNYRPSIFASVILAVVLALLLGWFGSFLDGKDEYRVSKDLSDAQKQAASDLRRDKAAAVICRESFGPQVSFTWTDSGTLVCIPKGYKK